MHIKVKDHKVPPAGIYNASNYPGEGAYRVTDGGSTYLVIVVGACCYAVTNGHTLVEDDAPLPIQGEVSSVRSVSEGCFLKAIALMQKPELVTEICSIAV